MNTRNTENKFFTTLFATFAILMLTALTTQEAHTQNYQQQVRQEVQTVKAVEPQIEQPIATVYVIGKRLPKSAS